SPRHVTTSGNVITEADSPLAPELTAEALPAKVKIPQIGMYDGTSDPDAHLGHYTSWMDLHGASDALRCRMFSLTLGPRAQKWYYTLPPHSIWKWQQLRAAFRSHFIGAQICLIPKESITNIVQKDDETVKDYVARFNDRIQNMEPCHPETLLVTAIAGLKPNSMFRWTLCQNKPATFQEFLVRAQQFIIAEESMSVPSFDFSVKQSKTEPDTKKKNKKNFGKAQFRNSSKGYENTPESRAVRDQYLDNVRTGYHAVYSARAATIYEELKEKGIIPDPKPVRTPEDKLDKTRYCAYHKSPGHNTDECLGLLSALLRLIGQPQLQKFQNFDNCRKGRPLDLSDDEDEDNRPANQKRARASDKEVFTFSTHVGTSTDNCRKSRTHDALDSSHCIPRVNSNNKKLDTSRRKVKAYAREAQNAEKRQKSLRIGANLQEPIRSILIQFLQSNSDVFAWKHEDMKGIDPQKACHRLNLDKTVKPVIQKRWKFGPDRQKALEEEVNKLINNKFVKEAKYPTWISNPVLVKKATGLWRLCIDFSDLNQACPKDSYPILHIDYMVDATSGHQLMSFLDAYSGYNQIPMHPDDAEHTSFYSARGLYCYVMMTFGLKNAGATYQRLVNKMFARLMGHTMEVYVDDMLVKSEHAFDHIAHLSEVFDILREYSMVLNPKKCTFGVGSGKFLRYMVSQRGIEANPAKIQAILDLAPPTSIKGVQALTGRLAALNRFISKSTDHCKPFFDAIKKKKPFEWTTECQNAFDNIKEVLLRLPTLRKPLPDEPLYLYLGVSDVAVSAVLIRQDGLQQFPVYYVSKALHDAELRYPHMEKLAFALIIAARKLRPYFLEHSIIVFTTYPLRQVLHRPDTSGRMIKWAIELGQFDIQYRPRTAIKAQVLSDFIAEFTPTVSTSIEDPTWTLY
ncbi:Unknown protein, partial [Striga hermonthica]